MFHIVFSFCRTFQSRTYRRNTSPVFSASLFGFFVLRIFSITKLGVSVDWIGISSISFFGSIGIGTTVVVVVVSIAFVVGVSVVVVGVGVVVVVVVVVVDVVVDIFPRLVRKRLYLVYNFSRYMSSMVGTKGRAETDTTMMDRATTDKQIVVRFIFCFV